MMDTRAPVKSDGHVEGHHARAKPEAHGPRPHKIKHLKKKTVSSTAWTLGGHGAQQLVRFGGNLIMTRLLLPEVFGLMTAANSVLKAIQFFSDLGVGQSIIRDKRGDDPAFLDTAWTFQILRGVGVALVACLLAWPWAVMTKTPEMLWLVPVLALTALIAGFQSTKLATLNRRLQLGRLTMVESVTQCVGLAVMVVVAWLTPTVWALVAGAFVGAVSKVIVSHYVLPGRGNRLAWDREAVRELTRFGKWVAVSTAMTFLLSQGDKLIVSALLKDNLATVGQYGTAYLLSHAVLEAMRTLGPKVLLPVYSQLLEGDGKKLRRKVFKLRAVLLAGFIPPLLLMTIFGRQIVEALYPQKYWEAGWMLQILAAGSVGSAINISAGGIVLASGDSFRFMLLQVSRGVMQVVGMVVGYWLGGLPGFMIGMGASFWLNYPFLVVAIRRFGVWMPALDGAAFACSGAAVALAYFLR